MVRLLPLYHLSALEPYYTGLSFNAFGFKVAQQLRLGHAIRVKCQMLLPFLFLSL